MYLIKEKRRDKYGTSYGCFWCINTIDINDGT
jgi:hypothetical protein